MAIFQTKVKPQLQKEKPHLPRTELKCTHANRTHVKRTQAFRLTPPPNAATSAAQCPKKRDWNPTSGGCWEFGEGNCWEKVQFKFNLQPTMSLQKEHEGHKARSEHSAHFQQDSSTTSKTAAKPPMNFSTSPVDVMLCLPVASNEQPLRS